MSYGLSPWAVGPYAAGGPAAVASSAGSLTVTPNADTGVVTLAASWTGATYLRLTRLVGGVATDVRDANPIDITSTPQIILDREVPLDVEVRYQLTAGPSLTGTVTSPPFVLDSQDNTWLTHPYVGAPMVVTIAEEPEQTYAMPHGVFQVLGRRYPVAVSAGQRLAPAATLTVWAETFAERDAVLDLLDDGSPLLLRAPARLGHGLGEWISVGDVTVKPVGHGAFEHTREITLPYAVVDAPAANPDAA